MNYKQFMSYKQFETFAECREWVRRYLVVDAFVTSALIEGESHMEAHVVISLEPADHPARPRTYRTIEYAWRGFSEDHSDDLASAVLSGKAIKSLARIVWRADSAQASWRLRLAALPAPPDEEQPKTCGECATFYPERKPDERCGRYHRSYERDADSPACAHFLKKAYVDCPVPLQVHISDCKPAPFAEEPGPKVQTVMENFCPTCGQGILRVKGKDDIDIHFLLSLS